jgi:ABC-type antimicrobial peptide transport system permease subunit
LGRTLYAAPVDKELPFKVVGVVENVRHQDLKSDGRETLYLPARGWSWADFELCLVVRTATAPRNLIKPIRQELRRLDPLIPMAKVRPMTEYVADALATNRFALVMMLVFSLLAVALAAVGLYGVVAYSLERKTREIGIRMALGAQRPGIFLQAIREGMLPTLVGLGLGILGSLGLTRLLSNLLFGVGAHDPLTYVSMAGFLIAITLLACYVPAYRAVRLNPTTAIREE